MSLEIFLEMRCVFVPAFKYCLLKNFSKEIIYQAVTISWIIFDWYV